MTAVIVLFIVQGLLGAVDTLWHHELGEKLPSRPGAREELTLHALREGAYAVAFLSIPWVRWEGLLAWALAALLAFEVAVTLRDFLVEDRTRRLPPTERVLHTVMAIGFGAILAVLAPVLAGWAARPTGFAFEGHGWLSWAMTALGAGVLVWAVRDLAAVLAQPQPLKTAQPPAPGARTVLVTGATGFIGAALVEQLVARGERVIVATRDELAARTRFASPAVIVFARMADIPAETRIDAIVNLAGASVAGGPWTWARRRYLMASRIDTTRAVLALMARLQVPPALVSASAVGFYGDRGEEPLPEDAPAGTGFMAQLCGAWEQEAWKARALGARVCALRLGLVFDWSGGILPLLALPVRFGAGATMGSGRQWMPWLHRDDAVGMILRAIADPRWEGPVNAVTGLVRQGEFTRVLARTLRRPAFMKVPAWVLRLGLGELSDLMLAGQRTENRRLADLGYEFARPDLEAALAGYAAWGVRTSRSSSSALNVASA